MKSTLTPFQASNGGGQDAFVTKISSLGVLLYSTYLGGTGDEHATAISVDSSGSAYVTGGTFSTNFPIASAFQAANAGGQDAFVTKLSSAGNSLVYRTYLGGSGGALGSPEWGAGIAVDAQGHAFVAGSTPSINFPIASAIQPTFGGGTSNAFVSEFNPLGTGLIYGTYFGGTTMDYGQAIALDLAGNAYVAGYTGSLDMPVVNAVQATSGGSYDAFVLILTSAGSVIDLATYYGGSSVDAANGIAVDLSGNVYVAGQTSSSNFPLVEPFQATMFGSLDAFILKLQPGIPQPGFTLNMSPSAATVAEGASVNYSLTVTAVDGFNGSVNFATQALPTGVTGSFNPTTVTGSGSTTLTILTTGSASPGGVTITVTGISGSLNHNTSALLTITGGSNGGPPAPLSVTPNTGSGSSGTFAFAFSDGNGAADISLAQIDIAGTLSVTGACYLYYARALNEVLLASDAGAWQGPLPLGSSGTLQNSQCTVNGGASSASMAGNTLTVSLALSFTAGFAGAKNVYMEVQNATQDSGWSSHGTWTVP